MKTTEKTKFPILLALVVSFGLMITQAHATHSEGADITYKCLGGNQYELKK